MAWGQLTWIANLQIQGVTVSRTREEQTLIIIVKRKRASKNNRNSKSKGERFVSAFSIPEDDRNTVEDMINKLPTELLHLISSSLTMREAATMGILSRRCRYIWRTYGKLDFGLQTMMGGNNGQNWSVVQEKMCIFVRWVNEVLKLHCDSKIESFRVAYWLEEEHYSNVDEWIQFALNKGVQKLNISLVSDFFKENRKPYNFPYWLFTKAKHDTLRHLSLDLFSLDIPSDFVSFRSLSSLTLLKGSITQETVDNILSNCPSLEWLSITNCRSPFHLKFGGGSSSLKLRHLNIAFCNRLTEIEIYDGVHIASFEYWGRMLDRLLFKNGAQVRRLCFDILFDYLACASYALGQFGCMASDFPRLETLMLSMPCLQKTLLPRQLPSFSKLRRLVLTFRHSDDGRPLYAVATLLKVSPLLRKFELHLLVCPFKVRMAVTEITAFRHENLKVVEMYNFDGGRDQVEVALYMFNSCIALKKMKIDCRSREYQRDGKWYISSKSSSKLKPIHAYQQLKRNVPPSVKLVVM